MNKDLIELVEHLKFAMTDNACKEPEKAKRYYDAINNLQQALNEIKEYIKSESPDAGVSGKRILEIIEKVSEEE